MSSRRYALPLAACLLGGSAAANVVGTDLQNFNPTTGGLDFVTVQSSETLEPGIFNLGLFVNNAVNSLPYFDDTSGASSRLHTSDQLVMRDLSVGLGVLPGLELGLSEQYLMKQVVDGDVPRGEFTNSGPLTYRVMAKYRLFGDQRHGLALIATQVVDLVRNNPYMGEGGGNLRIFEIARDWTVKDVAVAANLGYRARRRGDPLPGYAIRPTGDQLTASAGASYLLPGYDTKLIVEVFGARPTSGDAAGQARRQASSAELLAGLKWDIYSSVALHAGGGTELINGVSSPDWRAYLGVNWAFGPVWERPPEGRLVRDVTTGEETTILYNLSFAFGSDAVPDSAVPELMALAGEIKARQYKQVILEGHTDSVGSEPFNQSLSERRASAAKKWLIEHGGLDAARMRAVGYGETRPIADNGNYQGRQRNRRVQVRVLR